jgi:hypothetical protein
MIFYVIDASFLIQRFAAASISCAPRSGLISPVPPQLRVETISSLHPFLVSYGQGSFRSMKSGTRQGSRPTISVLHRSNTVRLELNDLIYRLASTLKSQYRHSAQ